MHISVFHDQNPLQLKTKPLQLAQTLTYPAPFWKMKGSDSIQLQSNEIMQAMYIVMYLQRREQFRKKSVLVSQGNI